MKAIHPALALYKELFDQNATPDNPNLPEYIVSRSPFIQSLKQRGIEHPENIIEFFAWEQEIGLDKFAKRVCNAYRRQIKQRQEESHRNQFSHP